LDDVREAATRIDGVAHRTPVLTCQSLAALMGRKAVYFKVEALQKTGSFKFRGALNAIASALENEDGATGPGDPDGASSEPGRGPLLTSVVTHSSGNHAQAVALAAATVGGASAARRGASSSSTPPLRATIVMPRNTPHVKRAAVADFGGEIVLVDNTNEAREREADRIVEERGGSGSCLFVHPSEDPLVIAGQGTVGLEMLQQVEEIGGAGEAPDVVIVPVGGGGLASGVTITLRGLLGSRVKIVLAEPRQLDDAARSFYAKQLSGHDPTNLLDSVADGLKTTLGPNTWPIVRDLVDDVLTVSEREILVATRLIWERLKISIEPSAGVGVAVALSQEFAERYPRSQYPRLGIVLCGGNVDVLKLATKMAEHGLK
jgi:threonine dehydratase